MAHGESVVDRQKAVASASEESLREDQQEEGAVKTSNNNKQNNSNKEGRKVKKSGRHGARNENRHKQFVDWLWNQSNLLLNNKNKNNKTDQRVVILDVGGGGRGELALRLALCSPHQHQQRPKDVADNDAKHKNLSPPTPVASSSSHCQLERVVIVDPRPADQLLETHLQRVVPKLPKKWRQRIQARHESSPQWLPDLIQQRIYQISLAFYQESAMETILLPTLTLINEENKMKKSITITTIQQQEPKEKEKQQEVRNQANNKPQSHFNNQNDDDDDIMMLLLGFHADDAVEPIVDIGLKYNIPFVVVPCCVFANSHPERQLWCLPINDPEEKQQTTGANHHQNNDNGQQLPWIPVRSHEQFCRYLLQKHQDLERHTLDFSGRNVAIVYRGNKNNKDE